MTTITDDVIVTAQVVPPVVTLARRAGAWTASLAHRAAIALGAMLKAGAVRTLRRILRGLIMFVPDQLYLLTGRDIPALPDDADAKLANDRAQLRKGILPYRRRVAAAVTFAAVGWGTGGWLAVGPLVCVLANLILCAIAAVSTAAAWSVRAKVEHWGRGCAPWLVCAGVSVGALWLHVLAHWSVARMAGGEGVLFLAFVAYAAGPDGTTIDNGVAVAVPAADTKPGQPNPVQAVLATKVLAAEETEPVLLQPGVVYLNGGAIWKATIDTRGPSAEALLTTKARAELAARLGLSSRRLILTVDEDRGSRLHMTGVVGQAWRTGRSPLLALEPVDLWQGIPWGPTIEGDVVTWKVFERNGLLGGESGAGKSTALAGIWSAFALASLGGTTSRIWVADGGEVDTKPLSDFGLASGWTTELPEAIKILTEVRDEVNRRQHLLGATRNPDGSTKRKIDPEFFAEHGLSFDLCLIDEVATFTQRKGKEAADLSDLIREIAQRCRKVGIHFVLSTQSPSVDAIDGDARDVLPVRWLGRARSVDLGNKVMGKGAAGRGVSVTTLPNDDDSRGVGWYSAPGREIQMRPYDWTDADLAAICRRGVELRRTSTVTTAADDDRVLADRVSALIKAEGAVVGDRRVMLARDVATRLEVDQMQLRAVLGRLGIGTQKVWRSDDESATNRAHYVLTDFPSARAM